MGKLATAVVLTKKPSTSIGGGSSLVYTSTYKGNTEKIAEIFAKEAKAELLNLKKSKHINVEDYDLIGFGSGVYKENISEQLGHPNIKDFNKAEKFINNILAR